MELMKDPVLAMDGHTYEREAIEKWFSCSSNSPLTNERLESKMLVPNRRLKAIIASFKDLQAKDRDNLPLPHADDLLPQWGDIRGGGGG